MLLIHCLQDSFGRISPWWCSGGLLMVCTSFMPFAFAMCLQRFNVKICTAILHKFRFLVTKTATAQTNTAKHLTVCKSYPRKGFFPALAKLQWRFVSSYLRLTSAVLLSCLSVSIEVGLSSSLTCMSCGVSAIEDDGLSATKLVVSLHR